MNQQEFLNNDKCIVVDEYDNILGDGTKLECHRLHAMTPKGLLHRAFSLFLFNNDGKLLLQQRAPHKITFPNVWTNTCCSHPLYGLRPSEVDRPQDVRNGRAVGVKRAAIRKLKQELGTEPGQVPIEEIKFLTRVHYCAADTSTYGPDTQWGENEIDYILFVQKDVGIKPNPEEVNDVRYVSYDELLDMMRPENGLLWSPWFRIIVDRFLVRWWSDLSMTLKTNTFEDPNTIHRFGRTEGQSQVDRVRHQHGGIRGRERNGALKVHKEPTLSQIVRVDEIVASTYYMLFGARKTKLVIKDDKTKFCDDMLGEVSRSFAMVIRQLPSQLHYDILVFYLILRGLDTIEDDVHAFGGDLALKVRHLQTFHQTALLDSSWTLSGVGYGHERLLLERFCHVAAVYRTLPAASRAIIAEITRRMGFGMAEFVAKDLGEGTASLDEYNRYCHFVAGLVGEGLTQLFTASGLECLALAEHLEWANSMGLFLQKTNIIRDYLEDYNAGRRWWPQEIWKAYSMSGKLGEFKAVAAQERARWCLNHLIVDALELVPDCLQYLEHLSHPDVFRFCAIPQTMAIATLDRCFGNADVFTGVVKIRKGLAAKMILGTRTVVDVHKWFHRFAVSINCKIDQDDPNAARVQDACNTIIGYTFAKSKMGRKLPVSVRS